ncbi:MAG: SPOR domain-containing protein, partial [Gammaproteobacteria bacterium]|nr:SPOR domain-containing protein [Gammaproteobacteria bacterium]
PRIKHLEQKLGGIEMELTELGEAGERLQESFRSLGGLELDLTSQLDELRQQLETTVQSEEATEQTVQHDTAELDDTRAQAQPIPLLQENHQQQVDGQLDRIEELIRSEQERVSQLEDNFSQAQDKSERYRRELEQSQRLQQVMEEHLDGLSTQLAGLIEQGDTLTASMETQAEAQQALAEKVEEQAKVQGALAGRIDEQAREQQTLTEEVEQQRQEQRGLSERIEAHAQEQQALAERVTEQATQQSALLQETESINALLARLELSDQENGSQISSIETQQRALQQQIEQETPRIDAHDQRLQLLASNFETLDANSDELQLQIDKNQTTGRTHRNALIALLLFMLLGGFALYLLNSAQINQSEERVTQKLITPDPGDITRDDLSERLKELEAELTHNRERLTEAATGVAEPVLLERLNRTEQQLERLAAALSSFEVDRQQARESEAGALPAMAAELRQMQLEIERINGTLAQLSQSQTSVAQSAPLSATGDSKPEFAQTAIANPPAVATAADAESGRLARIEQAYAQLQTQVSSWSEQLQTVQREQPVSRIAAIEQALQETTAQLHPQLGEIEKQRNAISRIERSLNNTRNHVEERLEQLEKHSSSTAEQQRQLADQVNQITTQLEKPQLGVAPQVQKHAVDWQLAQTAQRYSIQLAGARNLAALADFAARQSLQRDIAIYRTRHINREWYILLYGTYTGFREANEVLEELPATLNRFHPWIRKLPGDAERIR